MTEQAAETKDNRALDLRSIANSIEALFPSAADLLRGISREMESES